MDNNNEFRLIKEELIHRFKPVITGLKQPYQESTGMAKLDALTKNLENGKLFGEKLSETLNDILKERNFSFTDDNKEALIAYLKPTNEELTKKFIMP